MAIADSKHSKVSVVERCNAILPKSCARCGNRRIYEADWVVGVGGLEAGCGQQGDIVEGMDPVGPRVYLLAECEPDVYSRKLAKPVVKFNEYRSWHYQWFCNVFQEFATNAMVWITLVKSGEQNTSVDYERHGVLATSSKRSSVSRADGPLSLAKRPKVGLGRACISWSHRTRAKVFGDTRRKRDARSRGSRAAS